MLRLPFANWVQEKYVWHLILNVHILLGMLYTEKIRSSKIYDAVMMLALEQYMIVRGLETKSFTTSFKVCYMELPQSNNRELG